MQEVDSIHYNVKKNKHEEVNQFLRHKYTTNCNENTIVKYSRSLKRFFHDYFPDTTPQEAEIRHFEQFLQKLENSYNEGCSVNKSMTDRTKHTYLSYISSFYNYALKRPSYPEITSNPAQVVLEEIPQDLRSRPETATWDNACKIVKAMDDPRNRLASLLLLKTGVRLSELLNIKQSNIDTNTQTLLVTNRKNGGRTRFPLDRETVHEIKKFQQIRKFPDSKWMFMSRNHNRLGRTVVQEKVKEKAVQTEVMPQQPEDFYQKFTPHTFRTVFTTVLRNQGMKEQFIKHLRDDSMTGGDMLDHYTKINNEQLREEFMDSMPEVGL